MGMYSYFIEEDLKDIDKEGIKQYMLKIYNTGEDTSYKCYFKDFVDGNYSFRAFDGHKIIQYWYDEFQQFLRDVAVFIGEGWAEFEYETGDERAKIIFENAECSLDIGTIDWNTDRVYCKNQMSKELQDLKLLRRSGLGGGQDDNKE